VELWWMKENNFRHLGLGWKRNGSEARTSSSSREFTASMKLRKDYPGTRKENILRQNSWAMRRIDLLYWSSVVSMVCV
jgi:hypothetical protein